MIALSCRLKKGLPALPHFTLCVCVGGGEVVSFWLREKCYEEHISFAETTALLRRDFKNIVVLKYLTPNCVESSRLLQFTIYIIFRNKFTKTMSVNHVTCTPAGTGNRWANTFYPEACLPSALGTLVDLHVIYTIGPCSCCPDVYLTKGIVSSLVGLTLCLP